MKYSDLFNLIKKTHYETVGDDLDYQVLIDDAERNVYLLFEESSSKEDWRNNFRWFALPYKPYKYPEIKMWVHRGFAKVWKSGNDEVMSAFIKGCEDNPEYMPIIAGWSFGGAMAQLAAEDFYFRTKQKAVVITYGAPKILFGKKTWKHFCDSVIKARQFCHVSDLVTKCIPVPGFRRIDTSKVGKQGWKFWRLFNTDYHCCYGNESLYKVIFIK